MTTRSLFRFGLVALVVCITVCSIGIAHAQTKPRLVVWEKKSFADVYNQNVLQRAKEFGQKYNCEVEVVFMPLEDLHTKLLAAIEARQLPDIATIPDYTVPKYHKTGVLSDLSGLFTRINKQSGPFFPGPKAAATIDGKQWFIPYGVEINAMYYRKDVFEAHGVRPPNTWDELLEVAKKINNPAGGMYALGLPASRGASDGEHFFRDFLWSYGSAITAEDGKTIVFDSPETIEAVSTLVKFFNSGINCPGVYGWDDSDNNRAYLTGQAAIIYNTGSIIWKMRTEKNPLLEKTGLFLVPAGPKGRFTSIMSFGYIIMQNTKHRELAEKLIEYLLERDFYAQQVEQQEGQMLPVFEGMEQRPFWRDPLNAVWLEMLKYGHPVAYPGPYTAASGEVLVRGILSDMVQRATIGMWPVERAVKEATQRISEIYEQYQ